MSLFIKPRDYAFFTGINRELVNQVIQTAVVIYAVDKEATESNLYGESSEKVFWPGLSMNALISHDAEMTDDTDGFGPDIYQDLRIAFFRKDLQERDFYPERGDFIKWNAQYYEIDGIEDNQMIAGRHFKSNEVPDDENDVTSSLALEQNQGISHSIVVTAHMVSVDVINVRNDVQ